LNVDKEDNTGGPENFLLKQLLSAVFSTNYPILIKQTIQPQDFVMYNEIILKLTL